MERDDGIRGKAGVVVSLREMSDGTLRVTVDDVLNESRRKGGDWRHREFVTHKDYEAGAIRSLDLPDNEFASLGHYLLARLNASQND